jgi:hypothetical protein
MRRCTGNSDAEQLCRISWLSRNLDDEEWAFIFDSVERINLIGFMTSNLAHPTSFRSRIIEIAGEPKTSVHYDR